MSASAQTIDNMMVLRKHKEVQTTNAERTAVGSQWDTETVAAVANAEAAAAVEEPSVAARFAFAPKAAGTSQVVRQSYHSLMHL